ncbi:hypothetical protein, partial [Okeania sp. SIO1H2]|uniref:hypothetical protein n=1 Tax=Okeania sp. SIO1H2 TaxID=2607775 RepID=UPI00257BF533
KIIDRWCKKSKYLYSLYSEWLQDSYGFFLDEFCAEFFTYRALTKDEIKEVTQFFDLYIGSQELSELKAKADSLDDFKTSLSKFFFTSNQ